MVDYGDFEEVVQEQTLQVPDQSEPIRVRLPRQGELIGIIVQRYGGNRMEIKTTDGKSRNCRVPGKYKKQLWLRPNDIVLVMPWPDDDSKGDVIFKYHASQANQLRKKGLLKSLTHGF
ncbi:translation initiation factor eIF-1A [Candidatus Pacearchaeota archaeon]|nr:translation initiation factor eIF-1A [Candidatus Pacearchaeota archaeon]